jgi:predicted nucleic acid-binding protein
VLIDLSKGMPGIGARIDQLIASGAELGVCAINIAEFMTGIPSDQVSHWERLLSRYFYWDIPRDTAIRAGEIRHAFARQGITLQTTDALIAALALGLGATILTDNVRHFLQIADVRVRSLRSSTPL